MTMHLARLNNTDLEFLGGSMHSGKLTSVIDRRYTLAEFAAALSYLETGRARGKVIVTVE